MLESILLLPLFLLLLFALMQVGQLGIAIALVNYGASSAAREAVMENNIQGSGGVEQKFRSMLAMGLQFVSIRCASAEDADTVAPNVKVIACAQLSAYPFVGEFLDKAITTSVGTDCASSAKSLGPVAIQGPSPYRFIIEGKAFARMNYTPTK